MCGIAGIVRADARRPVDEDALLRMAAAIRHRGPDGYGLILDPGAGLVSTRLAIIDIPGGWQPLRAESSAAGHVLIYNGEVYNHVELRSEMEADGISFKSRSDTEVVLQLLESEGLSGLARLNGQFALAWWDPVDRRLTLVRDRFGVRPLFFATTDDGGIVFGSEAKALFASGEIAPEPDYEGLDEVFTLWGARPPRTVFAGISQVPPGGLITWEDGRIVAQRRWWTPEDAEKVIDDGGIERLLRDSVRLRLRADVPVGTYLSGGLDSSLITAIAQEETEGELRTFSVAFQDDRYDERAHQEEVAAAIGTRHHVVDVDTSQIAEAFPDVVRHVETPLVRTAPVPLFMLAQEVRSNGITVVATGEGADELFWGYDLFKEVALRELNQRDPEQAEQQLDQLYQYLGHTAARRGPAWRRFLLETGAEDRTLGSHLTRVEATATVKALYRSELAERIGAGTSLDRLRASLPRAFDEWSALERASWLEIATLLEPYLLAAQGDRVAMAHGVEGRYPFLDHRVYAHAAALPAARKLDGLRDKVELRELAHRLLPRSIAARAKQPYRAPEVTPFFSESVPGWVEEVLSRRALDETGIWDQDKVAGLIRRCRAGRATGVREGMALVAVISTQLWHREFIGGARTAYPAETAEPHVRIDRTRSRTKEVA